MPKSIKVYYYDFPFWRAEVLRAGLYLQGIEFENVSDKDTLAEMKQNRKLNPFGAFPILEVDGKVLSQTQACATYIGKLGGKLYPSNDDIMAQAKCDEVMNGCTEVTVTIASTFGLSDEEAKKTRTEMMEPDSGRLFRHLQGLDTISSQDGSGFACGKEHGLTVADLCVWRLVMWLSGGFLDHVQADCIQKNFANLQRICDHVESNKDVVEYKKKFRNHE